MTESLAPQIHEASLALLMDPGVRLEHEDICQLLIRHGARPGLAAAVVRIPEEMVRDATARAPKKFNLTNRRGEPTELSAKAEPVYWSCPGMAVYRHGQHGLFTRADMAETARLLERLENVQAIFGLAMNDVPPLARDVVGLNVIAHNSTKHIRVLCFSPAGAKLLTELQPIVGRHAWFSTGFTAHGPLRWTNLALEIFRQSAGCGIPVSINGEPMAGVSGPVTLAGSAAVGNAEILAGLVVNQLLEPGRPCMYNLGLAHVFDMRTANVVTGGPENALFAQLSAEMGRFYDLPSASWVSTESMCPDSQAVLEKMFGFQTHAAAGVTSIWGVGQLESEITFSPAQAVIDDEMIAYTRRFRRGCRVDGPSLAVEVTRAVGIAGSFLDHEHTLEHFRQELFMPRLLYRKRRTDWTAEGAKTLSQRAEEIADELIARPVDNALTVDQSKAINALTDELVRAVT